MELLSRILIGKYALVCVFFFRLIFNSVILRRVSLSSRINEPCLSLNCLARLTCLIDRLGLCLSILLHTSKTDIVLLNTLAMRCRPGSKCRSVLPIALLQIYLVSQIQLSSLFKRLRSSIVDNFHIRLVVLLDSVLDLML